MSRHDPRLLDYRILNPVLEPSGERARKTRQLSEMQTEAAQELLVKAEQALGRTNERLQRSKTLTKNGDGKRGRASH